MDKKEKSISKTLKKYYLTFILLTFMTVIAASALTYAIGALTFKSYSAPVLNAADIARPDFRNIDIADIEKLKGWVEIILNGKVVFVGGEKQDQKLDYTQDELNNPQNRGGKKVLTSFGSGAYTCSSSGFIGTDGKEYVCLVKIPSDKMKGSVSNFLDLGNPLFQKERLLCLIFVEGLGIFSLLFIICVFIFTRVTSAKIKFPLKAISEGIERMSSGDYQTRLDFAAESEIAAIRDVFNYMAERLEAAENEKQEAEESKKNMIVGISHDLKTPITTVYGYAKALNEGMVNDEEKKRKYLQYICDKAENMTKLIDDLFKYASLDSGKYRLERINDDFAEFIRELVATNFIYISSKGFQLELDIPEVPIMYHFDRNEMHRAVSNILDNCLKYNPSGTTLSISVRKEAGNMVLTMSDNGVGIAARRSDGGSGLGLSITRRIIEMHGGRIEIESDIGKGSEFKIYFPS